MAVIETWYNQDLQQPVKVHHIDGSMFSHNGNGNRIGVRVYDDGEPVTLAGTVSGYVITSDGSTVPCVGARSGHEATITIPPAAYQPGSAFITIFLTDGSTVTTLCAAQTNVLQARTGSQVSPGSVVTDWTQTINAAMQSVEDAAENLGGIIATPYASLTYPVPLGKYTYYNNGLYRCITPIAESEEFTAAHWTQVRLGDDVANLNSALSEYDAEFKTKEWRVIKAETGDVFTIEAYSNRSCQTSTNMLTLNTTNGYYSYCFVAPKEMVVAGNVVSGYYCIGTLLNPTTDNWRDSSGTLYMMGTNPTRYRTSDNNLPTHESPLTIDAGTQVVITVNSADVPNIDVFVSKFINIATTEDVENAIDELLDVKEAFVGCNLDSTTKLSIDKRTGYGGSTSTIAGYPAVQLDASQSYNSYVFTPTEEIKIAGMPEENTYYAITTLANPNYSSWQTSGTTLWNNGSEASRVRKSENNLPTESSPLTISAGTIVVVTVKAGEVANLLIEETVKNSIKEPLMGEVSPYIDVEMHNGYFYYYIPTKIGKYLRYKFVHFVDAGTNADGWVQRVVDLVPNNKVGTLMSVVRDGEWEMAIMLKDRPDFIGTMNHGSEIATIANLYFDGVKTTVTDGTKLSCKEIRVNQRSTMYDPNDETTVVGYHYKTHFITADGVRIEQRIEWVTDQTLGISYCGMLPATRGNDYTSSVQVTDHAYDNKTYTEYDCATTSLDPYLTAFADKGNTFYLRGETSGISMSLECNMENASGAFTFLSNAVYYNKIYFAHNNVDYQVSNGDEWKWVSIYKIEYAGN